MDSKTEFMYLITKTSVVDINEPVSGEALFRG
jgi:hypothetical protein